MTVDSGLLFWATLYIGSASQHAVIGVSSEINQPS